MVLNRIILLFILLLPMISATGQCGLSQSVAIADFDNDQPDTTNVSLIVSGAVNNNLADPDQGVCGVRLKFRHPFMKEMYIELISPSGKVVRLVGGDIVATNTPFITWDVTFVPNGSVPSPDPGFFPVWENNQLWQSFNTYTGSYHPNTGNLEDFNMGTVNGSWTFRCIDFLDESKGTLLEASLIFCDDTGVSCGVCQIDPGAIHNPPLSACQGDGSLDIVLDKTYTINPNTQIYNYTNIIFKDTTIAAYQADPDLRTFMPGTYTICPVQVNKSSTGLLPAIGTVSSVQALNEFYFQTGACAGIKDSCMTVTILPLKTPTNLLKYICSGESFSINDTLYSTEALHTVVFETGLCDSIVNLDLRIYDFGATIKADKDSISCSNNTIALQAVITGDAPTNLTYAWTTADGIIDGNPGDFIIDARKAGTYTLVSSAVFANATCTQTVQKTIFLDETFPRIDLSADTITCTKDTITVGMDVSLPVGGFAWVADNAQPFETLPSGDIRVWLPGKYTVSLTSTNGCTGSDSIVVVEDKFLPVPTFSSGKITCDIDSVQITTTVTGPGPYQYQWTGTEPQYSDRKDPFVKNSGTYTLSLTNLQNGCTGIFNHEVSEDKQAPSILSLTADTINCAQVVSTPELTSDHPIRKYRWQGPLIGSASPTPSFSREGTYSVTITSDANGCESSATFEIVKDTIVPEVMLFTDSLTCLRDTASLWFSSPVPLKSLTWSGPGYSSSNAIALVTLQGKYTFTFTAQNGCMGMSEIDVRKSVEIPDAIFSVDSFNCSMDTLTINLVSAAGSYTYQWSGPSLLQSQVAEPQITSPGDYNVTVTDPATGCDDIVNVGVTDFRILPDPKFTFDTLDCNKDSIQVVLADDNYKTVQYTGPGFMSDQLSPFIYGTGTYNYYIENVHHCVTEGSFDIIRNDTLPVISAFADDFKCFQDSVVLTGTSTIPGTAYLWKGPGSLSLAGQGAKTSLAGEYTVTGTSPNGCKSDFTFTIGYDTIRPVIDILPSETLTCLRSEVNLTANAGPTGTTVLWLSVNQPGNTLTVTLPGTYIAEATGPNQCIARDSITVIEDRNLPVFDVTSTVINCEDLLSQIVVTPEAPVTISWDNAGNPAVLPQGQLSQSTSFGGVFSFSLTNDEGCTVDGEVTVVKDTVPPLVLGIITDTIDCAHPEVDIGVILDKNSIEFLWNGPGVNDVLTDSLLKVNDGGTYFVMVKGDNHCTNNAVIAVVENSDLPQVTTFTDTLTCDKAKVTIGVEPLVPGHTYIWAGPDAYSSASHNPKVFIAGTYTVTVTASNGCMTVKEVKVPEDKVKPLISIADTLYLPCDTSGITLMVEADRTLSTYRWIFPDGSLNISGTPVTNLPGTYKLRATGTNGCPSDELIFRVEVDNQPPGFDFFTDTITCSRPTANLSAVSLETDVFYEWHSPSGIKYTTAAVNTMEDGIFRLIVFDSNKCRDSVEVVVALDTLRPVFTVMQTGEIQCKNRNVRLVSTIADPQTLHTATWNTTDGSITSRPDVYTITVDEPGNYRFELQNSFSGCKSDTIVRVDITPQAFTEAEANITSPLCAEVDNGMIEFVSLNGTPPYKISLNGLDQKGKLSYSELAPGTYSFGFIDSLGCELSRDLVINEGDNPVVTLDKESLILFGDSLLLAPVITPAPVAQSTFEWIQGRDSLACSGCPELWARPFVNTVYTFEYSIDGLCRRTATILVRVKNDIEKALPNIFYPSSGSGNNRFFIPQTRGIERINYLYVFDKWAENVYRAEGIATGDPLTGWDGTFDGKDCQPGVYVVIAELVLSDGMVWKYKGDVLLVR